MPITVAAAAANATEMYLGVTVGLWQRAHSMMGREGSLSPSAAAAVAVEGINKHT
jgi:hypothetical protein